MVTTRRSKGDFAERLVERYLVDKGFTIVERNFTCQQGEVDLIAYYEGGLYFVEVKATYKAQSDPTENCNSVKIRKIMKAAATYRYQMGSHYKSIVYKQWYISLASVIVNEHCKRARIQWIPDIDE